MCQHEFIFFLVPCWKYLMTSNNKKLHTNCTNVSEKGVKSTYYFFVCFLWQWSFVNIKRSRINRNKLEKKKNILTMHWKSHYSTNKDKCFYKHSIDMTFYILIQFLRKEEKSARTQLCPGWLITSCHFTPVKLCFHLGSHCWSLSRVLTEMETVKMTLCPTTVRKAETSSCESTQGFGWKKKKRCLPRFSLTHLRFDSSVVVQHLKVSWHILFCLHTTHPIQGTWGSHSRVSSLFSEVTQTRGQCTQLQGDFRGGRGLVGCQKKFQTSHEHLSRHGCGSRYVCARHVFSLQPLYVLPVNSFICARVLFGPPQRMPM